MIICYDPEARRKIQIKKKRKKNSRWVSEAMGMKELIQRDSGECEEELDKDRALKISTFKRQLKKEEHLRAAER